MIPIDPAPSGQMVYVGFTTVTLKGQIAATLQKVNYLGIPHYGVFTDRRRESSTHREHWHDALIDRRKLLCDGGDHRIDLSFFNDKRRRQRNDVTGCPDQQSIVEQTAEQFHRARAWCADARG